MCTKTAQQLGEKPALGLNNGIIYLMLSPFAIVGFIGYRWWKSNKQAEDREQKQGDFIKWGSYGHWNTAAGIKFLMSQILSISIKK